MKSGRCPKCGGFKIIVAHPPEYSHGGLEVGMTVTAEPRWVLNGRNPAHGFGRFVTYICRRCGFTEWYVEDPSEIPIGDAYRTRLLELPVAEKGDGSGSAGGFGLHFRARGE